MNLVPTNLRRSMGGLRRRLAGWVDKQLTLSGVDNRGWFTIFRSENRPGGWQQDDRLNQDAVLSNSAVYACATLIASDIGKVAMRLMQLQQMVWVEVPQVEYSRLLRKPNHYQTRQQFIESWVLSKLLHGNAYVVKVVEPAQVGRRDSRRLVTALYVLDPTRVTPLVAPDGSVFYQVMRDDLSKMPFDYPAIPASEVIHDRAECLFHPLVGISPLYAAYLPASQGLRIQKNSEQFFKNMSRPSGMLTAPEHIDNETAERLKADFEHKFSGGNIGRLFVAGDGLTYSAMTQNAVDAQLVEQLKLSAEQVCSAFHVPAYMIGAGPAPSDNNEALTQHYYSQCLQKLYTAIEDLLDDGLGLSSLGYRTEFDLDDLLRMDGKALAETEAIKGKAGIASPNESRRKFGYLPVAGGESPYLQQQNYSLAALAKRDAQADPFSKTAPADPAPAQPDNDTDKALHLLFRKSPEELICA